MTLGQLADRLEYPLGSPEFEELYTQTFDLNPVCSLEVGWHLFGEEYARGAFLVRMREELRKHGIPEATELPDHLTYALRLVERMAPADAGEFSARYLVPALDKMLAALEGKGNPYESVLREIREGVPA